MKDLKSAIQASVRNLAPAPGQVLCATYSSLETRTCDVENVLFYNVGPGSFRTPTRHGLSFSRTHAEPAEFPHHHAYWLAESGEMATGPALARFSTTIPSRPSIHSYWLAVKQGATELLSRYPGGKFGLRLTVPAGFNVSAQLKPLLDGVIAAFQCHRGRPVEALLGSRLGLDAAEVAALLCDDRHAVLGETDLVWPWGDGLQWNPCDHLCEAVDIRCAGAPGRLDGVLLLLEQVDKPVTAPPKMAIEEGRMVDRIVEVAATLGAAIRPVPLREIIAAFDERYGVSSPGSISATLGFYTVNMQSRFPNPADPAQPAPWMKDPRFYRVAKGTYQLLTSPDTAAFHEALAAGDARLFQSEYDIRGVLR